MAAEPQRVCGSNVFLLGLPIEKRAQENNPLGDCGAKTAKSSGFVSAFFAISAVNLFLIGLRGEGFSIIICNDDPGYFTLKRNSVVERKTCPGRTTVSGKCGWFTESGKCCVSRQRNPPRGAGSFAAGGVRMLV